MLFGPLEHVDRHFEQGVLVADRLRPRPLGRLDIGVGERARAFARQPDLNGWFGVHQISLVRPLPRGPSELTTEGNNNALPMVTILG